MTILLATGLSQAAVRSIISSAFLARGEKAVFEIRVEGQELDEAPVIPEQKDLQMEPIGYSRPQVYPGRRVESSFQYIVSSYQVGIHEIPAIEVLVNGKRMKTEPTRIEIFDPSQLKWADAIARPAELQESVKYACIIRIPQRKLFHNQTFPSEIKIYVPRDLARSVADWGVPEFERIGLAAWRYEASDQPGEVNLLGKAYVSLAYKTTMTAIAAGDVELGPATVRVIYAKTIFDRFAQRVQAEITLDVPRLNFSAVALPEPAPEGFENAVGKFFLSTSIKNTEVVEAEPLALDVIVSGQGNLDNLRTPKMSDASGWKVYDASAKQRGEERRELYGKVVFNQLIRPLELKISVPPFRMVYFDPDTEKYETLLTAAIPLSMSPAKNMGGAIASGAPQAMPMPVEKMTDILGNISGAPLLRTPKPSVSPWLLHGLAGLVAVALILCALWMRFAHLFEKDEQKRLVKEDYRQLSKAADGDGLLFLKAAGAFAERWALRGKSEEVQAILDERDRLCFQEQKSELPVSKSNRARILQTLRRAAFGMLVFAFISTVSPFAHANDANKEASEAFDAAKFEKAAQLWLDAGKYDELSADTLYHIGNAAYRMAQPGHAALYYRRALARDATHSEARQNLRFIERKYGSISVQRPDYQYAISQLSLATWQNILWLGAWLIVIGLLIFPATHASSRWRVIGAIGLVVGPLLLAFGGMGWRYFPNDARFAALSKQAVVVGEKVVLQTDAARTSSEVIDAPPGSLAEVIRSSGEWVYVSFATSTRGWVRKEHIEMIIPSENPKAPTVKKVEADGSST